MKNGGSVVAVNVNISIDRNTKYNFIKNAQSEILFPL